MSLLEQLLNTEIGAPDVVLPAAQAARADDRPARRQRIDRSDRWRLISAAIALWLVGLACTTAAFSLLTGWFVGVILAILAQYVLSSGQILVLAGAGVLVKLAGLALLSIDTALNVAGGDVLIPNATLALDLTSLGFWVAVSIGLAVAGLPEVMWRTARGK
jgi:hypothetical protein